MVTFQPHKRAAHFLLFESKFDHLIPYVNESESYVNESKSMRRVS